MKTSLTKGKCKAILPILTYVTILSIFIYILITANSFGLTLVSIIFVILWVVAGIYSLWIFIPQWDPWLRWINKTHKKNKLAALTFDDGPHEIWTEKVLDVLRYHNVNATFFVVGHKVLKHPHLLERIIKDGHEIGAHTSSHKILTFLPPHKRQQEIESSLEITHKITGIKPSIFRLPHGFKFPGMKLMFRKLGLTVIPWTKGLWDTDMPSSEELLTRFRKRFKNIEILLLHDGISDNNSESNRKSMIEVLPEMITEYKAKGYKLVKISDLMS